MRTATMALSALAGAWATGALAATDARVQCGEASWYDHSGGKAADGSIIDAGTLTAAHRNLPFGQHVRVENLDNGQEVVVTINDRGPFVDSRVIDVSRAAAEELDMKDDGVAHVRISVAGTPARTTPKSCR
jgi:rare lipoprotein A